MTVSLYGAHNPYPDPGVLLDTTTTDDEGWYGLYTALSHDYYRIVESDPADYLSAGATSVDRVVQTANWIEYAAPLDGKITTGNKF